MIALFYKPETKQKLNNTLIRLHIYVILQTILRKQEW